MGKTEKLRLGMLLETRRMMEKGQLSGVPDEDGDGSRKGVVIGTAATISGDVASAPAKAKKGKEKTAKSTPALEEEDDFFESD